MNDMTSNTLVPYRDDRPKTNVYVVRAHVIEQDKARWESWHGHDSVDGIMRRTLQHYLNHPSISVLRLVACSIVVLNDVFYLRIGGKPLRNVNDELVVFGSRAAAEVRLERITMGETH